VLGNIHRKRSRSVHAEGNEGLKPLSDFIQINIHIVMRLSDLIAGYIADPPHGIGKRADMSDYLESYRRLPSLEIAIAKAVLGNHPHEHCISKQKLQKAESHLQANVQTIRSATTFEQLHDIVGRLIRPPFKAANLLVYDFALRIGAYKDLRPECIYVHRGALDGAAHVLGQTRLPSFIQMSSLPPEFAALEPYEVEDFLCIYADDLAQLREAGYFS